MMVHIETTGIATPMPILVPMEPPELASPLGLLVGLVGTDSDVLAVLLVGKPVLFHLRPMPPAEIVQLTIEYTVVPTIGAPPSKLVAEEAAVYGSMAVVRIMTPLLQYRTAVCVGE
jgi:hypothetical protein